MKDCALLEMVFVGKLALEIYILYLLFRLYTYDITSPPHPPPKHFFVSLQERRRSVEVNVQHKGISCDCEPDGNTSGEYRARLLKKSKQERRSFPI